MSRKKKESNFPTYDELIIPTVKALVVLGGSGSVDEINSRVYEIAHLNDEILEIGHGLDGTTKEIDYRIAWSRTYLKKYGLLENSSRGIWALTAPDIDVNSLNPLEIVRAVRGQTKPLDKKPSIDERSPFEISVDLEAVTTESWKERLLSTLYNISPAAFERLAQRILRESGFIQVEVTGKVGDGGIDGKGIVRINGFLSFHVIFQCKRYRGSVSPDKIRDFRGAMQGRADKGLFITTGTFTRESVKEATRDGAPPIDLIDGEMLCDKLKELGLGVQTKMIESIEVIDDWFDHL